MNIDFAAMVSTLPVMLNGMVGGMFVMVLIWGVLSALYWAGKQKKS